jgi:hypothetical protein
MDYVTRQFINLTKKFRKELRLHLSDLSKAIDKHADATKEATHAYKNHTEANNLVLAKLDKAHPKNRHDQEREAPRNPLQWMQLAINAATFFVVGAYTLVAAYQLIEMKISSEAAKQTADAAIAAQRPWLKLELRLAVPLTQVPNGYDFAVTPFIENVGNSVATDVSFHVNKRVSPMAENIPPDKNEFAVAWGYKNWCEQSKPDIAGLETFFPKESRDDPPSHMTIIPADIQNSGFSPKGETRYVILVYGCLTYKFEGSPNIHHTGVVYELTARKNNNSFMLRVQSYSRNDLLFFPFPFAWEYAN